MNKKHPLSFFVVVSIAVAFSLLCSCDKSIWDNSRRMNGGEKGPGRGSDNSDREHNYKAGCKSGDIKNCSHFCNEPHPFSGYTLDGLARYVAGLMRFATPVVSIFTADKHVVGSGFALNLGGKNGYFLSCAHNFDRHTGSERVFAPELCIRSGQSFYHQCDIKCIVVGNKFINSPFIEMLEKALSDIGQTPWTITENMGTQRFSTSKKGDNSITLQRLPGNNGNIYDGGDLDSDPFCPNRCCYDQYPQACDMALFNLNCHCPGLSFPELSSYVRLGYVDFSIDKEGQFVIGNGMRFCLNFLIEKAIVIVLCSSSGFIGSTTMESFFNSQIGSIKIGHLTGFKHEKHVNNDYTVVHYRVGTRKGDSGSPLFIIIPVGSIFGIFLIGIHTSSGLDCLNDVYSRSGLALSKSIYEMMLGFGSHEFKKFNVRGPKEEFFREEKK